MRNSVWAGMLQVLVPTLCFPFFPREDTWTCHEGWELTVRQEGSLWEERSEHPGSKGNAATGASDAPRAMWVCEGVDTMYTWFQALEKAKDAGRKERVLVRQREQVTRPENINLDLTYSVSTKCLLNMVILVRIYRFQKSFFFVVLSCSLSFTGLKVPRIRLIMLFS